MSTSAQPKSLALMFLLGAFLCGGAVGFAADRAVSRSRPARSSDERTGREAIAQHLHLSAQQRQVFDSVFDWRRARNREIMLPYRPMLDSMRAHTQPMLDAVRDSGRVLLLQSLDSAQRVQFKQLIDSTRRSADSATRGRGGNR